jgi:hypothetical protein
VPRGISGAIGSDAAQIEASFCAAIRIAKKQKSISLEKRARQPTRNIGGKERAGQEVADSDYLSVATQPGVTLWSSHIELVFHPQVEGARYALSID